MTAKFITIEGIEGVGKTTNIEFIKQWLVEQDIKFIATREPGGTPLAEEIRQILLSNREEAFDSTAELLMMFAARSQHLNQLIKPALEEGKTVLCDRFTDATFAYQGGGRKLSKTTILNLENMVQKGLQPDLTFYLDIEPEVGLERAKKRGELDRFEKEAITFFGDVRAAYLERVENAPSRYAVIDAGKSLPEVQAQIKAKLDSVWGIQ